MNKTNPTEIELDSPVKNSKLSPTQYKFTPSSIAKQVTHLVTDPTRCCLTFMIIWDPLFQRDVIVSLHRMSNEIDTVSAFLTVVRKNGLFQFLLEDTGYRLPYNIALGVYSRLELILARRRCLSYTPYNLFSSLVDIYPCSIVIKRALARMGH